jgi:hypothetical protein
MRSWNNPPRSLLAAEVRAHADFAIFQALAAPCLAITHRNVVSLGGDTWRVEVGVSNTGWLPTNISVLADKERLVLPLVVALGGAAVDQGDVGLLDGSARRECGQLAGRQAMRFAGQHDGTPDRTLATWLVRAAPGTVDRRHSQPSARRAGDHHRHAGVDVTSVDSFLPIHVIIATAVRLYVGGRCVLSRRT